MSLQPTHEDFASRDIYMFYDFEDVLMRWDYKNKETYVKFLSNDVESLHPAGNKLANDISIFGREITKEEYDSCEIIQNEA